MSKMLLARSVVIFVSAMAMTRQEYNDLRGWQLPENENGSDAGYLIEDSEGEQNTDKFKGFVQWLPKSEFERKYIVKSDEKHPKEDAPKDMPVATVDFGSAVYALKQGKKVARSGWNGKGMFLALVNGSDADYHVNSRIFGTGEDGNSEKQMPILDAIYMKTANDELVPWLASQTDVLSEDWVIIG